MDIQIKSAILDLLDRSDFFDRLKTSEVEAALIKELAGLDTALSNKLKNADGLCETFNKFKECNEKLFIEGQDSAVAAAFKLGLKIGIEAGN